MDLSRTKNFITEKVTVQRDDGGEMEFVFRPYSKGDEEQIVSLIKSEYGDSYGRREFYDPEYLSLAQTIEKEIFLLILHQERLIGMVVMFIDKDTDSIELGTQVLLREYRGLGLAKRFLDYVYPLTASLGPQCITAEVVAFHSSTSTMCEEEGMVATGFMLGYLDSAKYNPKYAIPQVDRQSLTYYILPVEKKDAGKVYVPKCVSDFVASRYEHLGVNAELVTEDADSSASGEGSFELVEDAVYSYRFITVDSYGTKLVDKILEAMCSDREENWTYSLKLPMDSPGIGSCFNKLKEAGFFFSGILPLVGDRDYILMHYSKGYELGLEYLKLTEDAKKIRDYIIACR